MGQQIENRSEKRRKQPIFLDLQPMAARERAIQVVTTDISASGAGVIINRRLPLGSTIMLSCDGKYKARGRIVNLSQSHITGLIRAGVQFVEKDSNWPW
jgi:hypothetical protein